VRSSLILSLILLPCLLFSGCVRSSTYQMKVNEAAQLNQSLQNLQARYDELTKQKKELSARNDELDRNLADLKQKSAGLQEDLGRAREDIDRLEKVLSARSEKAGAAMAEMRKTIDGLEEKNRDLSQQVENERIAREARIAQMKNTYDQLVTKMDAEIKAGEITISDLQGKLTVNMVERILFDSGKAEIKPAGKKVLGRVGDILKDVQGKAIRVEGHTDNVPISSRLQGTFPTNWELSAARAINVVHFLQDKVGIPGEKLSACGFSQYRPVADNSTPKGRALNRRIQIVLVPLDARVVKPLKQAAPE
jgi:chemotaxis protein MotB